MMNISEKERLTRSPQAIHLSGPFTGQPDTAQTGAICMYRPTAQ
ncbi:hypothetical protein [Salmonella enterica]|nr:hypothetical protein [Salmonella enterica]